MSNIIIKTQRNYKMKQDFKKFNQKFNQISLKAKNKIFKEKTIKWKIV